MRWNVVLLGLVVLRTKAQDGFCPMYTKRCHTVMNRSKPFWGQFWGRIGEINSYPHHSNKRAVLVPLRNADTYIAGFSQVKSPTNPYISFTLRQEVVHKHYSTPSPHTAPVTARNAPVWARSQPIGAVAVQSNAALKSPLFGDFFLPKNGFSCAGFARTGFTCTGKACTNKY